MFKVRRALISVSDKRGLVSFARGLSGLGVEILSTGGTARELKAAGIEVFTGAEGLSVSQAVDKYRSGQLNATNSSDVTGHWK